MKINLNAIGRQLKDRIQSQLDAEDRLRPPIHAAHPSPIVTDEIGQLHTPIIWWLRSNNWPFHYSNPTKRTNSTIGWPDFDICASNGKRLMLECKTSTGALSKEQDKLRKRLATLGHHVWIIRSWKDFADAIARTVS